MRVARRIALGSLGVLARNTELAEKVPLNLIGGFGCQACESDLAGPR